MQTETCTQFTANLIKEFKERTVQRVLSGLVGIQSVKTPVSAGLACCHTVLQDNQPKWGLYKII